MFISKVFAPLFAIVLAAAVNASPVASPEANASSEIAVLIDPNGLIANPETCTLSQKRTPGNVYICPQTGWGGDCTTVSAANSCNNLPGWQDDVQSFGPDAGATCYGI